MKLVLELLGPPRLMGARRRCELHTGSLSIGRSPEAGWVIPDSDRMISRLHLRVDSAHGEFMLTDTSANGVFVNGSAAPVGYGASTKLRDGDRLQVGEAQIAVSIETRDELSAAVDPFKADAARPALGGSAGARDPLGGPFGAAAAPAAAPPLLPPGPGPAPRGAVDANWMIEPPASSSTPASLNGRGGPSVSPARTAQAGRVSTGGQRSALDLVDQHPDLSARELASAVDKAARSLDPSARSALLEEIAASIARL